MIIYIIKLFSKKGVEYLCFLHEKEVYEIFVIYVKMNLV